MRETVYTVSMEFSGESVDFGLGLLTLRMGGAYVRSRK